MTNEYFLEIGGDAIVYVHFKTEKGEVNEYVVKLSCCFKSKWHEVVRYDNGHNCPHKDILDVKGDIIRKIWYDYINDGQALTMAILDVKENCEFYKQRFEEWLEKK